jgi:hypothetical protein
MRNSQLLRSKLQLVSGGLGQNMDLLWRHSQLQRLFPAFLVLLHQVIRASVPLMQTARAVASARQDDIICTLLTPYLERHITEEMHHDAWLLEDLESAGFHKESVLAAIPSPNVAALVGAQYYWVEHHHPLALLAYIAVLEGSAGAPDEFDRLEARAGLPRSLFRTYRLHGEFDPKHTAELDDLLDNLPLDVSHHSLLGVSGMNTVLMLAACIRDTLDQPLPVPATTVVEQRRPPGTWG